MFQALQGNRVFSPNRDIVQLFPFVIGRQAVLRIAALQLPPALKKYAEFTNLQKEDLIQIEKVFAEFVNLSVHYGADNWGAIWEMSGMAKLPQASILLLTAAIGEATMGVFYRSVRAAIRAGSSLPGAQQLGALADVAASVIEEDLPSSKSKRLLEAEGMALPEILDNNPTRPG